MHGTIPLATHASRVLWVQPEWLWIIAAAVTRTDKDDGVNGAASHSTSHATRM
ncbi:hypothetical protein AURDEDRAFT_111525 [Auricularia subglabra TFB-10046 SS5]|nr:hypothetical protein AURDEDRAFT_111525 [Auricularia subglabra TFB-10046 SS5]